MMEAEPLSVAACVSFQEVSDIMVTVTSEKGDFFDSDIQALVQTGN